MTAVDEILIQLVKDNVAANTKVADKLDMIHDDFKEAMKRWDTIGANLVETKNTLNSKLSILENNMKWLMGIAVGIFSSLVVAIALFALTR